MSGEVAPGEHFPGCHPEDAEGRAKPPQARSRTPRTAGTAAPRRRAGCGCFECYDNAGYVPPTAAYHCRTCGRWWAWMTGLNITTITFGEPEA